jgi:hypothetical protein
VKKEGLGGNWPGHLLHVGMNTTAGTYRLHSEGHPKVPKEERNFSLHEELV